MKRRIAILIVLAAALAAGALWLWRPGRGSGTAASPGWSVGDRLVYDLELRTHARVAVADDKALDGDVAIAGRLELRAYGRDGDAALVELSLAASRVTLTVGGVDALGGDPAGELGDTRVWLAIAPTGTIASIQFAPEARPAWKDLAAQLVGWIEVVRSDGETWSAAQVGPFGKAEVAYARHGTTLTRTRTRYAALDAVPGPVQGLEQDVHGSGTIALAGARIERLDERETIAVRRAGGAEVVTGDATLRLVLRESGRTQVAAPRALGERRRPGERVARHDERALAEQRIGELTPERALTDLIAFADIGLPDADAWLWSAIALVRLHPELCEQLETLATSGKLGQNGVALVADLLASAGTIEAQTALRGVVTDAAVSERARVALVQRLSVIEDPTPETIAFAREMRAAARERGDVDGSRAAAYVAGNLAGTLRGRGDAAGAAALVTPLVDELARTAQPDDRVALTVAIGSAGLPEHGELLVELAGDRDAAVRRAAILGLERQASDGARDALVELTADGDSAVTGAALRALGERDLDDQVLDTLASRLAGGVDQSAQGDLARLLIAQHDRGADLGRLAPAIEATLARGGDPTVAAALRGFLR